MRSAAPFTEKTGMLPGRETSFIIPIRSLDPPLHLEIPSASIIAIVIVLISASPAHPEERMSPLEQPPAKGFPPRPPHSTPFAALDAMMMSLGPEIRQTLHPIPPEPEPSADHAPRIFPDATLDLQHLRGLLGFISPFTHFATNSRPCRPFPSLSSSSREQQTNELKSAPAIFINGISNSSEEKRYAVEATYSDDLFHKGNKHLRKHR
jgi:hypothetical protein